MARMRDIRRGLEILEKFQDDATDPCAVDAQHDELFAAGPAPEKLNAEDRTELSRLGWSWHADLECWSSFT